MKSTQFINTFYKESGQELTANWDKNKNFTISQESIFKLSKDLLKPFRSFVEPSGSIFYEKHPLLKAIYFQIKYEEKQIKNLLNFLLNSDKLAQALQYQGFDSINDRYIIPISSDSYSHSLGKIISRSASGKTLLVEPIEICQMNDKRIELLHLLEKKIIQISKSFCETVQKNTYFYVMLIITLRLISPFKKFVLL